MGKLLVQKKSPFCARPLALDQEVPGLQPLVDACLVFENRDRRGALPVLGELRRILAAGGAIGAPAGAPGGGVDVGACP
jgi:hypothetical protein